jgi:hypothetical protein
VGCCGGCGVTGRKGRGRAWPPDRSVVQIFFDQMRDSSLQELSLKIAVHARNLFNTDPWLESYDVPEVKPFVLISVITSN